MFKSTTALSPRRPKSCALGFVYFVQVAGDGPIKIGWTADPQQRLIHLQIACPYSLILLGTIEGNEKHERLWHRVFAQHRLRGEWFMPSTELMGYIELALERITPNEFLYRNPRIARWLEAEDLRLDRVFDPCFSLLEWLDAAEQDSYPSANLIA